MSNTIHGSNSNEITTLDKSNSTTVSSKSTSPSEPSSWFSKFPDLSACASTIRNLTYCINSRFSSALNSIKWSLYNCYASVFKLDQMNYSSESIQGTTMTGDSVSIPSDGSFKAGGSLLNKLTRSLFETVVSETTKLQHNKPSNAVEPVGIQQAGKDITRCNEFTIHDENGEGALIGFNPNFDTKQELSLQPQATSHQLIASNAINKITELVGGNALLATAIISTANQTLGNTINLLSFRADKNLTAENGIGFPSSRDPTLKYNLQKVVSPQPTHYLLKCEITAPAVGFLLKKSAAEVEEEITLLKDYGLTRIAQMDEKNELDGLPLCTLEMKNEMMTTAETEARRAKVVSFDTDSNSTDNPKMESKTFLSIKITPNPNFDQNKAENAENFPCSLEAINFTNEFTTAQSRGETLPLVAAGGVDRLNA